MDLLFIVCMFALLIVLICLVVSFYVCIFVFISILIVALNCFFLLSL